MDQDEQKENRRNHESKRLPDKHHASPHEDLRLKLTKAGDRSGDSEICVDDTECNREARNTNQYATRRFPRTIRREPEPERSNRAADDDEPDVSMNRLERLHHTEDPLRRLEREGDAQGGCQRPDDLRPAADACDHDLTRTS